jgi:hypothetical protein
MANSDITRLARELASFLNRWADEVDGRPEELSSVAPAGSRQRQILELPGLGTWVGMKAADVAAAIDYGQTNTQSTLRKLQSRGLLEIANEGGTPRRWRRPAVPLRVGDKAFVINSPTLGGVEILDATSTLRLGVSGHFPDAPIDEAVELWEGIAVRSGTEIMKIGPGLKGDWIASPVNERDLEILADSAPATWLAALRKERRRFGLTEAHAAIPPRTPLANHGSRQP